MTDRSAQPGSGIELRPAHLRAFLCLAEAGHLTRFLAETRGPDFLWPGFDFAATPVLLYDGRGEAFLAQHPHPPTGFELFRVPVPGLEGVPLYHHRGAFPSVPAAGPAEIGGRVAAALPLRVFRPGVVPESLVAGLIHEAFHAFQWGRGQRGSDLSLISEYPELSPVNNALGNLEARILYGYLRRSLDLGGRLAGDGSPDPGGLGADAGAAAPGADGPVTTAYAFSLIRRERRAMLEDETIEYERGLESAEGLARYVQAKALLGAVSSLTRYVPGRAFSVLAGRDAYSRARELVAEQVGKLPGLNVNAAGAAWWRFFCTGMALGLFADDLDPEWKHKVARGQPLDSVVEERVTYDGGSGDERAIERLKEEYGYDARLDAERRFGREEKRRKEELLSTLLKGSGTRLTFDVSDLLTEETWAESGRFALVWDPGSVETVTKNVRIHRRGLRFTAYGTDLRFTGLPVVEDLKNRLFHVSVPSAGRLRLQGDGQACTLERPAAFEDGLEVILPGVVARARSGYVQNSAGTLYIKIAR